MQEQDTSSVDFSNAYATLGVDVFKSQKPDKLASKPDSIQKRKVQPLPTDSSFALMKLPQVLAHMQVSRSNWLEGVRIGKYPKPVKISTRRIAWKVSDLKAFVDSL